MLFNVIWAIRLGHPTTWWIKNGHQGPKNGRQGLKRGITQGHIWPSDQLLPNKFLAFYENFKIIFCDLFYLIIPSMSTSKSKIVTKVQKCRVIPSARGCGLFFLPSFSIGKQSHLLLPPTEVEFGLQVGVEIDNSYKKMNQMLSE